MNPYSHLVIAAQLERDIAPAQPAAYYWGAVAPDIRYVAGMQRSATHIAPERILDFLAKYPELDSFIEGYLIHCLTDLVDLSELLRQRLLMRPVLKRIPPQFVPVMIESYFLENRNLTLNMDARQNAMLSDLGIQDKHVEDLDKVVTLFLKHPTFDSVMEFLKSLVTTNPRAEKYLTAAKSFNRNQALKSVIFALAEIPKLEKQIIVQIQGTEDFKKLLDLRG